MVSELERFQRVRNRYETILSLPVFSVFILDLNGNFLDANNAALRLLGCTRADVLTLHFSKFIEEDAMFQLNARITEMLSKDPPKESLSAIEYKFRTKQGAIIWVEIDTILVKDEETPIGVLALAREITYHKQVEYELRSREQSLICLNSNLESKIQEHIATLTREVGLSEALSDYINDVVSLLNVEGTIIYQSPSTQRVFGYKPDKLINSSFFEFVHFDDRERLIQTLMGDLKQRKSEVKVEGRLKHKSGSWRNVLFIGSILLDFEGVPVMVVTIRDITEQVQNDANLRANEVQFRRLFETMAEGVVQINPEGKIIKINPAGERLLGLSRKTIEGRNWTSLPCDIFHSDSTPMLQEEMAGPRALREIRPVEGVEMGVKRPDNSLCWITMSASPMFNDKHELLGIVCTFTDVTVRKQIALKLTRSESCLKEAQRLGHIGFWEFELATNTMEWSDEIYRIFERDPINWVPTAIEKAAFYSPAQYAALYEYNRRVLEEGLSFTYDIEATLSNGRRKHLAATIQPEKNATGQVIKLFGTIQDITTRVWMENSLRNSEARYRQLVELSQEGIWVIDTQGFTTFVNPHIAEMLGYTVQEMIGQHFFKFMDEKMVPVAKNKMAHHLQGIKERQDFEFQRKDGQKIFTVLDTCPVSDETGTITGAIASVVDVTDRKRAEDALRASEMKYKLLVQTAPNVIIHLAPDGKILEWNAAAERTFGVRRNNAIGTNYYNRFLPTEIRERVEKDIKKVLGGTPALSFENDIITADKTKHSFSWAVDRVQDTRGVSIGVVAIGQDITDRKRIEEELQLSRELAIALNAASSVEVILRLCVDALTIIGNFDSGRGYLVNPGGDLEIIYSRGLTPVFLESTRVIMADTQNAHLLIKEEPVFLRISDNPLFSDDILRHEGLKALGILPIRHNNHVVAAIILSSHASETIPTRIWALLESISAEIGGAVKRAEAIHALQISETNLRCVNINMEKKIEELRQAKVALQKSEAKYRLFIENFSGIAFQSTLKDSSQLFEGKITDITGYTKEEFLRSELTWKDLLNSDDTPRVLGEINQFYSTQSNNAIIESRINRKDGAIRWVRAALEKVSIPGEVNPLIQGIITDITPQKQAEEEIRASLHEKEILLQEIHHRIKNNLQIVSSILGLQLGFSSSAGIKDIFQSCQNRIYAISLVHEKLYQSGDFSSIDTVKYFSDLIAGLRQSAGIEGEKIALELDLEPFLINMQQAIYCGLIVSELISNVFKHAFPGKRTGALNIMLARKERSIYVQIRDNGIGIPTVFNIDNSNSLGLHIARNLSEKQLGGQFRLKQDNGTVVEVTFPMLK